ncbi:MFS transporter [Halobacteriaceae archaeon GCM10025711]
MSYWRDPEWRAVGGVTLWQVTASACYYSVFAATSFLRTEFGLSRFLVGLAVTALTLGYTLFLFPAGAAVDGYGERPVMTAGLLALGAGTLGVYASWSYPTLLVAVFVLGAAYASAMPATNRAIAAVAPRGQYNLAMGVKQVGVTAGSGLAAVVVTSLAPGVGTWESAFLATGVVAAVVAVLFARTYRASDASGDVSLPDVRALSGNRPYALLSAAGLFLGAALFTTTGYAILFVHESVGTTVGFAGLVLATMQVTGSLGRVAVGGLADRLPWSTGRSAVVLQAAHALVAVGLFLSLTVVRTPLGALAVFALLGFAVLGFTGLYHGALVALVPDDRTGAATAGGQTTLNAGALVAPPVFGVLADAIGYDAGWTVLAAGSVVAALLLVGVHRTLPAGRRE